MDKDRDPHLRKSNGMKLVFNSGLAGLLAIATVSGGQSWANPITNRDLPKVDPDVSTSGSLNSKPLPAPIAKNNPLPSVPRSTASDSTALPSVQTNSAPADPSISTNTPISTNSSISPNTSNTTNTNTTKTASSPRFFCQVWNGRYTVMYSPENRSGESFPWAVPQNLGGGWQAEKRCAEISRRLEEYRPDGLQELRNAKENGYNTVCATTQSKAACRLVFTVPPGQDPVATRNSVFQNLTVADSGQMTQGVNTFVNANAGNGNLNLNDNLVNLGLSIVSGNSSWHRTSYAAEGIDLTPYLDPSDGGSGLAMTNGVQLHKGLRLNPERFR